MKKIIVVLASILLSLVMFGQEHLGFKNIPIDGTTSQFVAKLKTVGYTVVGEYSDDIRLTGTFMGKNCTLSVNFSAVSKTVHTVYVIFDKKQDWASLKNDYENIKRGLTIKYGKPTVKEEFRSPYKEGDGYAYIAFKGGHADWISSFTTAIGYINLYIREQDYSNMTLIISYCDKKNYEKSLQELADEL